MPGRPITAAKKATKLWHQVEDLVCHVVNAAPERCFERQQFVLSGEDGGMAEVPEPTDKAGIWWCQVLHSATLLTIAMHGLAEEQCKKADIELVLSPCLAGIMAELEREWEARQKAEALEAKSELPQGNEVVVPVGAASCPQLDATMAGLAREVGQEAELEATRHEGCQRHEDCQTA